MFNDIIYKHRYHPFRKRHTETFVQWQNLRNGREMLMDSIVEYKKLKFIKNPIKPNILEFIIYYNI